MVEVVEVLLLLLVVVEMVLVLVLLVLVISEKVTFATLLIPNIRVWLNPSKVFPLNLPVVSMFAC